MKKRTIPSDRTVDGADWSGRNLTAATLDGMTFRNVSFAGCNLTGANMSECRFTGCDFANADMADTALCESRFEKTTFRATRFTATDITGSALHDCVFDSPSALLLPFALLARLRGCRFEIQGHSGLPLTLPPIVVTGAFGRLAILDDTALLNETVAMPLSPDQRALRRDRAAPSLWPLVLSSVLIDLIREAVPPTGTRGPECRTAQQFF